MEYNLTECFVGQHVYMTINYFKGLSGNMMVKEKGWLLHNKNNNTFSLAFYTNYGDLDFLPTFDSEEIDFIEVLDSVQVDMNLVPPQWRVNNSQTSNKNQKVKDGMTTKGPYQTSGMSWL